MSFTKIIETYRIINGEFVSPLASAPQNETFTHNVGDLVFIIDECVWIKNFDSTIDEYHQAVYSPAFVRINPSIFQKVK